MNKLYNDDCFNVFPTLKKNSIDLVVVDLPYGQTSCKWDSVIDLEKMWVELKKICIKKCMYVFFCTTKFGVSLINSKPKWFRYDLVWEKSRKVGFLSANKMPLRKHEMIYVFGENGVSKKTYNPQKTEGKPYKVNDRENGLYHGYKNGIIKGYENKTGDRHPSSILEIAEEPTHEMIYVFGENGVSKKTYNPQKTKGKPYTRKRETFTELYDNNNKKLVTTDNKGDRHPSTVLEFKNPHKPIHRTQKPVELYEWLIKSYSNEGDTVLDFCAGSMTNAIACINTNRKYICIEKDKDIFELGKKRVV